LTVKITVVAFKRSELIAAKGDLDNILIQQINEFNYLGCSLLYINNNGIYIKLQRFQYICGAI
jgi:hypothetical protein